MSLRNRIAKDSGNERALRELENYGWSFFYETWDCQPDTANRWLHEQPGYEDASIYSFAGKTENGGGEVTAQDMVAQFVKCIEEHQDRISKLEAELLTKNEEIAGLNSLLEKKQEINRAMAEPLFEAVRVKEI